MKKQIGTGQGRTRASRKGAAGSARRRSTTGQHPATLKGKHICTPEERHRMIREQAYFLAERRGFQEGFALDDWLQAEAMVDAVNVVRDVTRSKGDGI